MTSVYIAPEYYERVFDLFVPENGALLIARHDDKPLGAIMIFAVGSTGLVFLRRVRRVITAISTPVMACNGGRYSGQKRAAGVCYDLWGIPDHDHETLEAQFKDRSDGLWGVYGFKRGWGGQISRSSGTWDLAYNPLVYRAYQTALKLSG